MKIKDVADRSGFSTATLRYYEQVGLIPEPTRTAAGYRSYDESTVERLAFITRAKQLGCTLDEIADLTTAWEGGRCGPLQDRLRSVVAEKLAATEAQIAQLLTLSQELRIAAAALEQHRPEGACDDRCGCVAEPVAIDGRHRSGGGCDDRCGCVAEPTGRRAVEFSASANRRVHTGGGVR